MSDRLPRMDRPKAQRPVWGLILLVVVLAAASTSARLHPRGQKEDEKPAITKADGRTAQVGVGLGGIRVDFQGATGLAKQDRELLAAQVIWTLALAGKPSIVYVTQALTVVRSGLIVTEGVPVVWVTVMITVSESVSPLASVTVKVMVCVPIGKATSAETPAAMCDEPLVQA